MLIYMYMLHEFLPVVERDDDIQILYKLAVGFIVSIDSCRTLWNRLLRTIPLQEILHLTKKGNKLHRAYNTLNTTTNPSANF